jgi:hypothetical protein
MKKYALFSAAAALLLVVVLWMVFRGNSTWTGVGPPPERGYDYDRPNYEPVVHPTIPELGIAPADLRGEFDVDATSRSAARDTLIAFTGRCTIGETKVTQAFVHVQLYTLLPNGRRKIHQESQTTAKIVEGELPYRVELRTPADSGRLRLHVEVMHFPWDFDPNSDSLPDDFTIDSIADGEFTVE